jgi:hypothetical protein
MAKSICDFSLHTLSVGKKRGKMGYFNSYAEEMFRSEFQVSEI